MKKQIPFLFLLMSMLLLTGCRGAPAPTEARVLTATSTVAPTNTPSPTATTSITPSPTPSLPAPSPTAVGTPTIPPDVRLKIECLTISPTTQTSPDLSGWLILGHPKYLEDTYLRDMATGTEQPLPQNENIRPLRVYVSPDLKWMAYVGAATSSSTDYKLVIRSRDGKQIFSYPHDNYEEWDRIGYWLDNQRLALVESTQEGGDVATLLLLNPFTGQKQVLVPDYPEIDTDDWMWRMWPTKTIYDPTLTRVVYPGNPKDSGIKLVYWDRQSNQSIAEIPRYGFNFIPPKWSPDGKQFVYVKSPEDATPDRWDQELILVNWDGEITPLTRLSNYYDQTNIYSFSWSPDGRYLAFWLNGELATVDVTSKDVKNYCISTHRSDTSPPIWSPDGRYMAVEVVGEDEITRTVLVDIIGSIASLVAEDMEPEGWMGVEE